jgi:hypothetical protein
VGWSRDRIGVYHCAGKRRWERWTEWSGLAVGFDGEALDAPAWESERLIRILSQDRSDCDRTGAKSKKCPVRSERAVGTGHIPSQRCFCWGAVSLARAAPGPAGVVGDHVHRTAPNLTPLLTRPQEFDVIGIGGFWKFHNGLSGGICSRDVQLTIFSATLRGGKASRPLVHALGAHHGPCRAARPTSVR